ncbi:hypothetical protein Gste01_01359 [Geobacillus stearothermophilus ATCC 7953]
MAHPLPPLTTITKSYESSVPPRFQQLSRLWRNAKGG